MFVIFSDPITFVRVLLCYLWCLISWMSAINYQTADLPRVLRNSHRQKVPVLLFKYSLIQMRASPKKDKLIYFHLDETPNLIHFLYNNEESYLINTDWRLIIRNSLFVVTFLSSWNDER